MKRTRAETSALNGSLRFLRLQADIQFEVIDVGVEALGRLCDLLIGVPFQERRICCKKTIWIGVAEEDGVRLRLSPRNCDDVERRVRHGTPRVK